MNTEDVRIRAELHELRETRGDIFPIATALLRLRLLEHDVALLPREVESVRERLAAARSGKNTRADSDPQGYRVLWCGAGVSSGD